MASSQSIPEAMQNVLPALDLIIGKRIEALTYDKTVTATIIDASDSSIGKYIVTDGSSTYEAFSDNTNYSKGTVVLVTVVENDYSKQKIIVGRYVTDDSEHFTYVDPMKSFIDITKNIITKDIKTLPASLKANGNITEKTIWSIAGRNFKGYDKLAIKADFKSWLKELGVRAGTYGLRLDIVTRTMGTTQTQNSQKLYSVVLNTNDFYGDPYNYETYYTQKKVVDISEMECIESMTLTFYQGNDFRISENELLVNSADGINIDNLFVNNIYISLGYSLDKFSEDTILLYTLDSATYASYLTDDKKDLIADSLRLEDYNNNYEQLLQAQVMIHNSENEQNKWLKLLNRKNMYCRWIHFVDEEEAVAYENYLDNFATEGVVVHWYQQVIQEGINDPLAGNYWQEITNYKNKFEYLNFDPDIKSPNQLFKIIIEVPAQEKIAELIYNDQFGNTEINKKPFEDYFKGLYYPIEVKNRTQFENLKEQYGALYTYDATDITYTSAANYTAAGKYYRKIINDPRIGSDLVGYTFYDWVMLGITKLEEEIQYYSQRLSAEGLNAEIDSIMAAYEAELAEKGLKRSDSAANDITKKYRRLLLDVEQNLNSEISSRRIVIERIQSRLAAGKKYYSAILSFTNEDASPDYSTLELANALQLTVDEDGYKGNYRIYDDDGQIISQKESQKKRIITASWDTLMSGDRNNDKIESITWRIPIKNTMIQKPEEEIEFSAYTEAKDIQVAIDFKNCDRQLYTYNPNTKKYSAVLPGSNWQQNTKYYYKGFESWAINEQAGYIDITRLGESFEPHEDGIEWPSSSGQVFRVKDFYTQANSNNTIYCTVRKNNRVYKAQVTLSFGPTGTNGTDYSFELEIEGKVPAITTQLGTGIKDKITIIPHLYNFEGNDIIDTIPANQIHYEWYSPGPNSGYLNLDVRNNSRNQVISMPQAQDDINKCKYHILKASITQAFNINGKQVFLDTYLPIPVRSSIIYTSVDGADRISYDAQGINPKYYKNSYKIYNYNNRTTTQITNQVRWEISYGAGMDGIFTSNQNANDFKKFYPTLSSDNKLIPASYYIKSNGKQIAVNCYINNNLVWTQPLYIYQNSYTSALLNSWDGSLSIDEENGTILSSLMGAGMKDERNRFNGVIMGDVASITSNTSEDVIPLGLYGYNEGVQSFGFKVDGTAFIGKSDRGQITFDGNSGQIASLSRKADSGMLIDLDDGLVDIKGANLSGIQFIDLESSTKTTTVYATIVQALNKQKALLNSQKTKIQQTIANDFIDQNYKLAYQKKSNLLYNPSINAIDAILNEFNSNPEKYDDDWKKWLYIQEIGQTQLLNDEHFKPQYTTSRSRIRISTTNPYFYVQSQNQNKLIHIADDSYYLKTDNFKFPKGEIFKADGKTVKDDILDYYPIKQIYTGDAQKKYTQEFLSEFKESNEYGEGFLFDLQNGYILGYNFKLKGVNNGQEGDAATKAMKDSYFELNSNGDPFLAVHYRNTDNEKINILNNKGLLPYVEDWDGTVVTGTLDQTKTYKNYNVATPNANKKIEKDLIRVSKSEFYLQSWNYIPSRFTKTQIAGTETGVIDPTKTGTGVLLDLTKGALYGHDFTLSMIDTGEEDAHYKGSYVAIGSDGQPYLKIHYQYTPTISNNPNWNSYDDNGVLINKNLDLINIGKGAWMIKSRDYQAPNGELIGRGLYFNLNGDENLTSEVTGTTRKGSLLTAYSFRIDAYSPGLKNKDYSRRIVLNSAATDQIVTGKTVTSYIPNYDYINAQNDAETVEAQLVADCNSKTDAELEAMTTGDLPKVKKVTKQLYDRPFMIGGLFSVSWKGLVTLDYLKANQGGKIGPFTISSWALYSNNGWLSNNESFYASNEPSPYGVYLGRDGLSVRDVFAVYKYAMHPRGQAVGPRGETPNSGDFEESSTDFVISTTSSPMYTGNRQTRDLKTKADDALNDYKYDYNQYFTTPKGTSLNLKSLRFFLKGGSVLDGRSVINGNSYIFGRLEVGESKEINLTSETESPTINKAIFYADTKIYGILKVTGKTYLGDKEGIWQSDIGVIAKTSNTDRNANDASVKKFGVVIYRNTLISGNVVIGNNLTVGMANAGTTTPTNYTFTAHSQKKSTVITDEGSIFRSYTKDSYFYGNTSIAGNFQAGLLDDTDSKSFIYAKTIELGREDYALNAAQQSSLKIYANTEQEGSFKAGRKGGDVTGGQPVDLYGGSAGLSLTNKEGSSSGAGKGYFKLYASTVYIEGKASVPSINLHVNSNNYINMNGSSGTDGGIDIKATKGIDINAGKGSFVLNNTGFALETAGGKAYVKGGADGKLTLGGDIVLTESGQEAVVNGSLRINGNVYANNLNATSAGVTMSGASNTGGTAGGFGTGGVSSGFGGGAGGTGLGSWKCDGANFSSITTKFVLNAEKAAIEWASDYIDAQGKGAGGAGIEIHSSNAVTLSGSNGIWLAGNGKTGLSVHDKVVADVELVSTKTLWIGSSTGGNGNTAPNSGSYYFKADGEGSLNKLILKEALNVKELVGYGTGNITVKSKMVMDNTLQFGDSDTYSISKSGAAKLDSVNIGGSTATIKLTSSGDIQGKQLHIQPSGLGGDNMLSVGTSNVTIKDEKLSYKFKAAGESRSLEDLKKLAFADSLKKKFKATIKGSKTISVTPVLYKSSTAPTGYTYTTVTHAGGGGGTVYGSAWVDGNTIHISLSQSGYPKTGDGVATTSSTVSGGGGGTTYVYVGNMTWYNNSNGKYDHEYDVSASATTSNAIEFVSDTSSGTLSNGVWSSNVVTEIDDDDFGTATITFS